MNQLLTSFLAFFTFSAFCSARMDDCYLRDGKSQRCLPPFVNAAYGKTVVASNTCGTPAEEYCLQTGVTGVTTSCHTCDSENPSLRHTTTFLTDFNNEELSTWWQSSTMLHPVQFPNVVNLTLDLRKAFDITYVRLRFHTSRPESFAIYKKKCPNCEWQPFQYYSGSCFATYGLDNKEIVTIENEQKPLCTDDFSDISPLTGGNVAFSTLESRPSAYNFDRSPVLQDWVKATAIRISLNRINTFGDEVFEDPNILKSYYYAISDLSVGGRCACNGHASECYVAANNILQCRCKHNTAGRDCELCADMFNDRPWARATRDEPAECQACDCNGLADTCYFDPELYRQTGHGGHCTNCRDFTSGPHCELCLENYYRGPNKKCTACECDEIGSFSQQCDLNGMCSCKAGVGGRRCDRCLEGYYGLSEAGCRACLCSPAGSVEGTICDAETGACVCKLNVEGVRCDTCKRASMNLQSSNPYGCTSCFCFGHSSSCSLSEDYTVRYILSEFNLGDDGWTGRDSYNNNSAEVTFTGQEITMQPSYESYFVAPDKFLGSQRFSYNQMLEFELSVRPLPDSDLGSGEYGNTVSVALPSREDIVLEGEGQRVTASITSQGNPVPNEEPQLYRFRLHEAAEFSPRLTPLDFQKMLNNLDEIHIRSSYGVGLIGHLDNVQLRSAERDGAGEKANWVEFCDLDGYVGDFADRCGPGFTRDPPNGGIYAPCVLCSCNGHSNFCDGETGICECGHNTMGDHCELCIDGYYFSGDESLRGTPQECQPCPCPQESACAVADDGSVVCTSCPPGHAGKQCEMCMDGWFGDPRGRGPCLRCVCNGNIDENAIMNCDRMTGECLKCIHNTTGFHCESCLPGYFGKPVTNNAQERCRLCECDHMGSEHITACNAATGQCQCRPNVEGRRCDRCRSGYWNLVSGEGCDACNCNQLGSSTGECDQDSGQCDCQPGVGGQRCDRCLPYHYHLSREGCTECECNADGSATLQCGEDGRCDCKEGVLGEKCDRCQENYYNIASGCIECPACYGLVQDAVETHRQDLTRLEETASTIGEVPDGEQPQGDAAFQEELDRLTNMTHMLEDMAKKNREDKDKLSSQTDDILETLRGLVERLAGVEDNVDQCASTVQEASNKNAASKNDTKVIKDSLAVAEEKLKQAMMDLSQAQVLADDSLTKADNMSRVAQEAEALATRHQTSAKDITDTAQTAYDKSRRAQDSMEEALNVLENLMNTLDAMAESENKIPAARVLRDDLLAQSSGVKDNAESAKNDSTDLFAEAGKLAVPAVDTDEMDTASRDVQSEAETLMPRIDELDGEYKENFGELKADVDRAHELLNLADVAQDTADMLLAQAHGAYEDAREAVTRGNATYQSVLDTKKSLESFDEEIHMNREDAERALGKVDEIQAKIDGATALTDEARSDLGSARAIATQANDKAQQSQEMAQNIQANARGIRDSADRSHERAAGISESLSSLEDAVATAGGNLESAEQQAESDAAAVRSATSAASAAGATATESKRRVNAVLGQLEDLLADLNNIADVSDDQIAQFEAQYAELRRQVDDAGVPDVLADLQPRADKQDRVLQSYDAQIAKLQKDIRNLHDIDDAIQKECSSVAEVEQP